MPDFDALQAAHEATLPALREAEAAVATANDAVRAAGDDERAAAREQLAQAVAARDVAQEATDAAGAPWIEALAHQVAEARGMDHSSVKAVVDADLAISDWERTHRTVPRELIYHQTTGDPIDPELIVLHERLAAAQSARGWVLAVQAAAVEAFKQAPLEDILTRNGANRRPLLPAPGVET